MESANLFQELYRILLTAEAEGHLNDMSQQDLQGVERILLQEGGNSSENSGRTGQAQQHQQQQQQQFLLRFQKVMDNIGVENFRLIVETIQKAANAARDTSTTAAGRI